MSSEMIKERSARICQFMNLKGKRLLEVGCGNGDVVRHIASFYQPEHICGVDNDLFRSLKEEKGSNWNIKNGNAEHLEFDDNSFDGVISLFVFEHIGDIVKSLSEIKRVLKPFGKFYAVIGGIWTSVTGHHYGGKDPFSWHKHLIELIPPWGHLYMNECEMKNHLMKINVNEKLSEDILHHIYRSNLINRLSRSEYLTAFYNVGMIIRNYQEYVAFNRFGATGTIENNMPNESDLTPDIIDSIKNANYNINDIGVTEMRIVFEKYASVQC